jgi:hypothetical protein
VSGHVSVARYPEPAPLCSTRVTGLHCSYGCLRLPESLPSSSLFRLVRGFAFEAGLSGSPWLPRSLPVRLDAALDPGADPCTHPIAQRSVACRLLNTVGLSQWGTFRGSTPSRSALPVTIAPRLLSRLRIKRTVTSAPARLNSRPVVSGYLDRLCTCKTTRPCQAATQERPLSIRSIRVYEVG